MRQLELWRDDHLPAQQPSEETGDASPADDLDTAPDELTALTVPYAEDSESHNSPETSRTGPPTAVPLRSAIDAGVFGLTTEGPIEPDEEEVAELTAEHANEMIILLADAQVLEEAIRVGYDPATGRMPKTSEDRQALLARLDKEHKRLSQAYADAVAAYAGGFGDAAAEALDQWVRKTIADGDQKKEPYPPSHPWHYFHAGDNAPPIPVDEIEPDSEAGRWLADGLPKNPAKRAQKLRELLSQEEASLAADKERYVEIIQRGAEALSRYDREIAHTSDAMAVATALALKYNHISQGLGRVAWLTNELQRYGPELFLPP
jgi:hypothetical protein